MSHFLNRRFVKHNFGVTCISNWTIYSFLGGLKKSLSQSQYYFHFNTSRQALDTHKKNVGKKRQPKVYVQINRSYSHTIFFVRSKTTPV